MPVDVLKNIGHGDYLCESGATDLFGHKLHSHAIFGTTASVPSDSDFQELQKSVKDGFADIQTKLSKHYGKLQELDNAVSCISKSEQTFRKEISNEFKDYLAEGSPFFSKVSSMIKMHIDKISELEKSIKNDKEEILKLKNTIEIYGEKVNKILQDTAEKSVNDVKNTVVGAQSWCDDLKGKYSVFFSEKQAEFQRSAMDSQTKILMLQHEISELRKLCERIEIAGRPFKNDFTFWNRLKWLFTGTMDMG